MCGSSSVWAKIALVLTIIAMILFIVGFSTMSWSVYQISTNSVRVGLWRMKACAGTSCTEGDVSSSLKTEGFAATQAFEILAFIVFLSLPFVVGVYVFISSLRGGWYLIVTMALCFTASLLAFVGMIIWITYVPDPYVASWSMGLTVIAAILAFIAGLLLISDMLDADQSLGRSRPTRGRRIQSPPNARFMRR